MTERLTSEGNPSVMRLATPEAFNFQQNLRYLARSSNECMFKVIGNKICKAIPVGHETALVEISAESDDFLSIRFLGHAAPISKQTKDEAAAYIREWFDLETDLRPFYELAEKDPLLRRPAEQFYGLRIMGIPDLFEALVWGILGQQITLHYAYILKRRFVELFGRPVEWDGEAYWIFPSPSDIAGLSAHDLAELKMTAKKCEYIIGIAQMAASGELSKERLRAAGNMKDAEKMLLGIRGIGPWTANYVLMRCLRFPDAFPVDDVGLHNAIKHLLQRKAKPSKAEILKLAASWTGWEAYATFYLWRVLY